MTLAKETIILAPNAVFIEAKKLADVGYFEKALELLNENKVMVDVYEEKVEMKVSSSLGSRFPERKFKGK